MDKTIFSVSTCSRGRVPAVKKNLFVILIGVAAFSIIAYRQAGDMMMTPAMLADLLPKPVLMLLMAGFLGVDLSSFAVMSLAPATIVSHDMYTLKNPKATEEQKTLLKGLTAVADWIGSGSRFDDPDEAWLPLVHGVVEEAGFSPLSFVPDLRFEDIFGFAPNAVQKAMMKAVAGPGVYALEAPMGMGKTEAALVVRIISRHSRTVGTADMFGIIIPATATRYSITAGFRT